MSFYNVDAYIDNEYGAQDNETLLNEIKKRTPNPTQDIIDSLKDQAEAQRAQIAAAEATKQAQEAVKAAQAEQDRIAKAKQEEQDRIANAKAAAELKDKQDAEARNREDAENNNNGFGTSLKSSTDAAAAEIKTEATPAKVSIPAVIPPPPKTAPIDTILFDDESVPIEIMSDMIFEDIGGHEIINIARNDTVNGQTVSYQPIKNLTSIQQQYNPNNIVALQDTSQKYFENFSIKLETKLPAEDGGGGPDGAYVYIEQSTGDLIVELINLEPDEQIEVEIKVSGTIYEAEFNES